MVAFLDLDYSKIKEIQPNLQGTQYYGIRIIKHRNYEDLLSESEITAKKWYNLLRRFCILSQFGMTYENVKVLGQGNFAKVFLVKRKSDKELFAAKVFDKKAILGDELEKVKSSNIAEMSALRNRDFKDARSSSSTQTDRALRRPKLHLLRVQCLSRR